MEKGYSMNCDYLIGYARADITPTEPVPLMGYGNTTRYAPGTAEDIAYQQLCLLRRLKGQ